MRIKDSGVLIMGAGEQASGVAHRLYAVGFRVLMTEIEKPLSVRRHVSFSSAVKEGVQVVEGIEGKLYENIDEAISALETHKNIPILIDPELKVLEQWKPVAVVDATLRKNEEVAIFVYKSITEMYNIPIVGLGPCWEAGVNCDCVIETLRGPSLGRVLWKGKAIQDTGAPEPVCGYAKERVLRASGTGVFTHVPGIDIGTVVNKGDTVALIKTDTSLVPVNTAISGIVRGLLNNDTWIEENVKVGDVDPRPTASNLCVSISDKARALSGAVLEAILILMQR